MSEQAKETEIEMHVAGIAFDENSKSPIILLKDEDGQLCLPIWIGVPEASSISSSLKSVEPERPMTHDLLCQVIEELGAKLHRVYIHDIEENTFFARLELFRGEEILSVDSRPSDAIALAVRTGAPLLVSRKVLDKAQMDLVEVDGDAEAGAHMLLESDTGGESNFAGIDKEKWDQILAEMDPDDFKYKM